MSNNTEKIREIEIWVSRYWIGKNNFKVEYLLNYWFVKKNIAKFEFFIKFSVYGEFLIKISACY